MGAIGTHVARSTRDPMSDGSLTLIAVRMHVGRLPQLNAHATVARLACRLASLRTWWLSPDDHSIDEQH